MISSGGKTRVCWIAVVAGIDQYHLQGLTRESAREIRPSYLSSIAPQWGPRYSLVIVAFEFDYSDRLDVVGTYEMPKKWARKVKPATSRPYYR